MGCYLSVYFKKQPPKVFCFEKGVLRNFTKFTRKYLCQTLFFNKVAGMRPATLLKKRLWHRCFSVNFDRFFKIPVWRKTSGRLLLNLQWLQWIQLFSPPHHCLAIFSIIWIQNHKILHILCSLIQFTVSVQDIPKLVNPYSNTEIFGTAWPEHIFKFQNTLRIL